MKTKKLLLPCFFILFITVYSLLFITIPDKSFSEGENRYLQKMPSFSILSLLDSSFTKDFESYVNDQFVMRDEFIGIKAQCEYLLGKRESNGIYFCDENYLINKYYDKNVDTQRLTKNIEFINQFIERQGNCHFMPVPSAQAILSEKLPPFAPTFDEIKYFKSRISSEKLIDISDIFNSRKNEQLYYKTDHHWTMNGAYYAYLEFCRIYEINSASFKKSVYTTDFFGTAYSKARLFSTKPDSIEVYEDNNFYSVEINGEHSFNSPYFREYLDKRDKYSVFLGGNNPLIKIENRNMKNNNLLIIKDSYAHSFGILAAANYNKTYLLDLRYYNGSISSFIEENDIDDILVLYGFGTLQSENSIVKILS